MTDDVICGNIVGSGNVDPLVPVSINALEVQLIGDGTRNSLQDGNTYTTEIGYSKFSGKYAPVNTEPDLDIFPQYVHNNHCVGGPTFSTKCQRVASSAKKLYQEGHFVWV